MIARDPQHTTGSTAGYIARPLCACGHSVVFHNLTGKPRSSLGQQRAACSVAGPAKCPCKVYRPQPAPASEGVAGPVGDALRLAGAR